MKLHSKFTALLLIALLISDCKKENIIPVPEKIIGKWSWEESYNPMSGITITRISENINQVFVFNKNGNFEDYVNNELVFTSTYEIHILESLPVQYNLEIEGRGIAGFEINNNEMKLDYSNIDSDIMTFKKLLPE